MASSIDAYRQAIEAHFNTQWADRTPIAWANVDFDPPDDAEWARFSILWGDAFEDSMGGDGVMENVIVGVVMVSIFGPPGGGLGTLNGHANVVRDTFNLKDLGGGIEFGAVSPPAPRTETISSQTGGRADEGRGARVDITAPFEVRETV